MANSIKQVWRDYDVEISTSATTLNYDITDGQYIIYQGKAAKRPNANTINIRLSDFVKSTLNSDVDINWNSTTGNVAYKLHNYTKTFNIKNGANNISQPIAFYNSYDYNNVRDLENAIEVISAPITNKVATNMPLFFTVYIDNGLSGSYSNLLIIQDENGNRFGQISLTEGNGAYLIVVGTQDMDTDKKYEIVMGGKVRYRFEVVDSCNQYSLYYQNATGGYDCYPINGKRNIEVDDVEYETYRVMGNNTNPNDSYNRRFQSNITKQWELHTGWLSDEESGKMYNILTSHKVWLYDSLHFTPVIITDKKVEYKTFTNEGRKKYYYTINVESANSIKKL